MSSKKQATIISTSSVKGGIGKSAIALNFGAFEANHNKNILFIDMDAQCDISIILGHHISNKDAMKKSSILRAINHDSKDPSKPFSNDFKPVQVTNRISLIAGSNQTKNIEDIMQNRKAMAPYVVLHVIANLKLLNKYDYIIIDTHNSFQLPTINSLIVSNYIFSPVTPNLFSINAMASMSNQMTGLKKEYFDVKTGKSDIDAKLYFIGNMIENTKASKSFLKAISGNKLFIANFKKRELVNKAINDFHSVYGFAHSSNDKKVIRDEINPEFKKINKTINKLKEV